MLNSTQIKDIVLLNLEDIRMTAIAYFINNLISRKKHGGGINQYRLKNNNTGEYITSLAEFKAALDPSSLYIDYFFYNVKNGGETTHPLSVVINNIDVELDTNSEEDGIYNMYFSSKANRIMFLLNYLSDTDDILPLKIFEVRII